MRIGIVEEKHRKAVRWTFYIAIPLLLLISYPTLSLLNIRLGIIWSLFGVICISGYFVFQNVADSLNIKGEVEIKDDSFVFIQNNEEVNIPFSKIKMMVLQPMLGLSRIPETFKVYKCQIKTENDLYTYQITREELKNGKLIAKNIMNPKAFDLITFLNEQNINYRFGKRIN